MKREHLSYTYNANGYMIQYLGVNLGGVSVKLPREKPLHWRHARANLADYKIAADREIEGIFKGYNTRFHSLIGEIARKNKVLPIYGEDEGTIKPGLYLALYHGFKSDIERVTTDDWGANGPLIGPLKFCQGTYATHLKLHFETDEDAKLYGFEEANSFNEIVFNENGCLQFQGIEYGDFIVANFPSKE